MLRAPHNWLRPPAVLMLCSHEESCILPVVDTMLYHLQMRQVKYSKDVWMGEEGAVIDGAACVERAADCALRVSPERERAMGCQS